jgi:hydrogenase-4 component B
VLFLPVITILLASLVAPPFAHWPRASKFLSSTLIGISGLTAILNGIKTLITNNLVNYQISSGFPNINWQFKLDSLSGFFLAIVGIVVFCIAIYAPGYLRSYENQQPITRMTICTSLFIAGMYLVLLAADVFSFMLAWELMSVASYFLVAYHHENSNNRSAALLYLLMAQLSGLLLLFAYGILFKFSDSLSFAIMHTIHLKPFWASVAFTGAFLGFAIKTGLVPLHIWLPLAHPVAPSHISALMSGVMLKVGVYGLLRFCFDLLGTLYWQWGILILLVGIASALLGVLYALMQHNLKRLLAYHSIENIGIIFIGIGLAFIFLSTGHPTLGALGLIAALYHCLNHALFKSLLFLGAGTIVQHTDEHDLEKMGGLIHKMPYTALFFLIGCISISALPPFNGFVSEWLTFQTALQATVLQSGILRILIPVTAALLALTGALAAACFVKVYGVAFLGQPRAHKMHQAHDPNFGMLFAMGLLALLCFIFGIIPTAVIHIINFIPANIIGAKLAMTNNWLWLVPISVNTASYSAVIVSISILMIGLLSYWLIRLRYKRTEIKNVNPWECGFGAINSRMQYSASAFAMPIRRVFKGTWLVIEKITKTKHNINYQLTITDWTWQYIYAPLEHHTANIARFIARFQGGNVRVYLSYVFFTLILLLWVVS